jgi:hypothetical protein
LESVSTVTSVSSPSVLEVELVFLLAVVEFELPAHELSVGLLLGTFEGVVEGHRFVEVDGLLLVVGRVVLVSS